MDILIGAKSVRPFGETSPSPWILLVHNGIVITTGSLHLAIHIYNLKCLHVYYLNGGISTYVKEVVISHFQTFCLLKLVSPVSLLWGKEKGERGGTGALGSGLGINSFKNR